jgi:hypothetical protein
MSKLLQMFAMALSLQVTVAGCAVFGPGHVESEPDSVMLEDTTRQVRCVNPAVKFEGKTYYLCVSHKTPLPEVALAFTLEEKSGRSFTERMRGYLLRLIEGKPVDAIPLTYYGNWYLADITGDGRDEVIMASAHNDVVRGLRIAPGLKIKRQSDLLCLKHGKKATAERYGVIGRQFGEQAASNVEVYRVGDKFEKLFEDDEGYHHACSSFVRSRNERNVDRPVGDMWYYYPVWADLYGTGLPVFCTVVVHKETRRSAEEQNYTVYRQQLVSYWTADSETGKWRKVETKMIIDIKKQYEPDLEKLKGILKSNSGEPTSDPGAK